MVHKPVQANVIIAQTCEKSTWRRASKCHQSRKMQLSHHARTPSRANTSQAYERKPSNFGDNWYMLSKKKGALLRAFAVHTGRSEHAELWTCKCTRCLKANAMRQPKEIPSRHGRCWSKCKLERYFTSLIDGAPSPAANASTSRITLQV